MTRLTDEEKAIQAERNKYRGRAHVPKERTAPVDVPQAVEGSEEQDDPGESSEPTGAVLGADTGEPE